MKLYNVLEVVYMDKLQKIEIGKRIQKIRIKNDMTLEEFAIICGTNKSSVFKWENGTLPNIKFREKIAAFAKITLDELENGNKHDQLQLKFYRRWNESKQINFIDIFDEKVDFSDYFEKALDIFNKLTSSNQMKDEVLQSDSDFEDNYKISLHQVEYDIKNIIPDLKEKSFISLINSNLFKTDKKIALQIIDVYQTFFNSLNQISFDSDYEYEDYDEHFEELKNEIIKTRL